MPAFDFAWDYRATLVFVTDPAYACGVVATDTYPKTYTNGNGLSINAGWDASGSCAWRQTVGEGGVPVGLDTNN